MVNFTDCKSEYIRDVDEFFEDLEDKRSFEELAKNVMIVWKTERRKHSMV